MAIRFDASGDYLRRNSDLPASLYTWMAWVYLVSDRNTRGQIFSVKPGWWWDLFGVGADGTTLYIDLGGTVVTGTSLSTGTWYHVACVRPLNDRACIYLNGSLDITVDRSLGDLSLSDMRVGPNSTEWVDMRMAGMKMWSAALTEAEIIAEKGVLRPIRQTNLYGVWPCLSGGRAMEYSGNGRTWTENGTLTDEDGPPITWGMLVYPFAATAGTTQALAGSSAGIAAVSGGITIDWPLAGSSAGIAGVVGGLALTRPLAGSATGSAMVAGGLAVTRPLAGQSAGLASTTGALSISLPLIGAAAGSSSVAGTLLAISGLSGQSVGAASTAATLSLVRGLAGGCTGRAATSSALGLAIVLIGQAGSITIVNGRLTIGDTAIDIVTFTAYIERALAATAYINRQHEFMAYIDQVLAAEVEL